MEKKGLFIIFLFTTATTKRGLSGTVVEAAKDLLFADVAVADEEELQQIIVLFFRTGLRSAALSRGHNIVESHALSILHANPLSENRPR